MKVKKIASILVASFALGCVSAYAAWQHAYTEIEMFSNFYHYIESTSIQREGSEVAFRMRVGVYEDPTKAFEEVGVSMNCAERSFMILDRDYFVEAYKDWDHKIGITRKIDSLSIAGQEVYNALHEKVC